ncbi:plasmid mobilization protein [Bifidobacterium dentium]|uniref:plasmid mobilization protein n=1 Tax=Bifidobacterium dentium TaxID=1689 RepID=UPI0018B09C60|nr:plasmid mobilization relaxosome protein MobC [Bifidobacterium dentium]MBF9690472.1 plasmid mobilization relaxosome protein MobC [Bifidobacterium dentium]
MTSRNQQHRTGMTRGRRIFVRVSDQEFDGIRSAAKAKGISVSRYLVEACEIAADLESVRREYETGPVVKELEAIRTEIWHIGHNVNQIARNTNRDMAAGPEDEYSAAKAVKDCARLLVEAAAIVRGLDGQTCD